MGHRGVCNTSRCETRPTDADQDSVTNPIDLDAVMNHPRRVQILRRALDKIRNAIAPFIDLSRPYLSGLETLPADGRFCWWATTLSSAARSWLIPGFGRQT